MNRLALTLMLCACCGARTELWGADLPHGDASTTCTAPPWILFDYLDATGYGIRAIHADGSGLHALDLGVPFAYHPSVSPDQRTLLFIANHGDTDDLVRYDLATNRSTAVAHGTLSTNSGDGALGKGAISPDDTLIAFEQIPDLHVMSWDGSNDRVLVKGPYTAGCCNWSYGYPAFSPDSKTVYFATVGELGSIHPDGSGRTLLEQDQFFTNPAVAGIVFANPSLSPDASEMVIQVGCDVSELRVYPISALPGDPCALGRKLAEVHASEANNEAANASWGPSLIAYDDVKDVYVIDPSGGEPTDVTSALTGSSSDPVWLSGCVALP